MIVPWIVLRREDAPEVDRGAVLAAVEDDGDFNWIELLCKIERVSVLRALTGAALAPLARVARPFLVLADPRLADGDSPPLLRALPSEGVLLAGLCDPADPEARRELRAAGCSRILSKPLNAGEFLDLLRDAMAVSAAAPPPRPRGRARTRPRSR